MTAAVQEVITKGPMRAVVTYSSASGTMKLECGHIKGKRAGASHPKTTECLMCLPLDQRRQRSAELKSKNHG